MRISCAVVVDILNARGHADAHGVQQPRPVVRPDCKSPETPLFLEQTVAQRLKPFHRPCMVAVHDCVLCVSCSLLRFDGHSDLAPLECPSHARDWSLPFSSSSAELGRNYPVWPSTAVFRPFLAHFVRPLLSLSWLNQGSLAKSLAELGQPWGQFGHDGQHRAAVGRHVATCQRNHPKSFEFGQPMSGTRFEKPRCEKAAGELCVACRRHVSGAGPERVYTRRTMV